MDLESKIILITGATQGIGKETAKTRAKQGHHVIIHGRNLTKLKAVAEEIKLETKKRECRNYCSRFIFFC
jgi:short-subunit dehydrogenase